MTVDKSQELDLLGEKKASVVILACDAIMQTYTNIQEYFIQSVWLQLMFLFMPINMTGD